MAEAHNSAAWLAAKCGRELNRALADAERAIKLSPNNVPALDTLAEIHFLRGDKARAVEIIEKALKLDPTRDYLQKQRARFSKAD